MSANGPDELARILHEIMLAAIPADALPHETASRGAEITLQALIRRVYADKPAAALPTLARLLAGMEEPFAHKTMRTADCMDEAADELEVAATGIAEECRRAAEDLRKRIRAA